jgi:hypothetical protein
MDINFLAPNKFLFETRQKPVPASTMIPEWWKKMPPYGDNKKLKILPAPNVTAKKCFPLIDAITAGYIMPLWADIFVEQNKDGPSIRWLTSEPVLESWPLNQSSTYEIPDGYSSIVFKYLHGWVIETPKNYSCLITHPIGYNNLPFQTLSGVIDTDNLKTWANSPFVVKKDFEGIIEKGTPMFQIIPFKRENWKSSCKIMEENEFLINMEKLRTKIISSYGIYLRKNKKYE